MTISVYIDNGVWDLLHKFNMDLTVELPPSEFSIGITREAEFEFTPLQTKNSSLFQYIQTTLERRRIPTDALFGFCDERLPASEQRVGGFGFGRFASEEELALMRQLHSAIAPPEDGAGQTKRPSGLFKNEADLALAMRAAHSVILTCDNKGPLKKARQLGCKVLFIDRSSFNPTRDSLAELLRKAHK